MSEPLVVEFEVAASCDHAFAIWTERCALWWPGDHTLTRGPDAIIFEPFPGGRIFERGSDGAEHEWGAVLAWEPPSRLVYSWHLFFDPAEATQIEVTFRSAGPATTVVRLEQRGWERLGKLGGPRRARTGQVWATLGHLFAAACAAPH